ncbi:MAG: hypothetical protein V3R61_06645 [candidate division NC10 bacterium]
MKRIGIAVLTTIILGAGVATAQQAPPITPEPNATTVRKSEPGRYVFYPAEDKRSLEYLLDTATGDMWVISRDPDTNYVYLGFVPKGPSFTFQDILQQKQQRGISPQP